MVNGQNFPFGVKTKIVATIGPASESTSMLSRLASAGADVFRLNFAHGNWTWHSEVLNRVRRDVSPTLRKPIAILQDLGGPKLRLGELPGGNLMCYLGNKVRFVKEATGQPGELTCTYPGLVDDLSVGDLILLADGSVAVRIIERQPGVAIAEVTLPGVLSSRQGIAAPGAKLQLDPLTAKDLQDLDWAAQHDVDFIGMSFVRRPDDLIRLRHELKARHCTAHIVAKIEKAEALDCLDDIIRQTDVVMVARGDLGVEIDLAQVPMVQKRIIQRCRALGVPVITATQMLESMRMSNRPTRAEVTDVANAILDGTDAVMLSAETAAGEYPVEAVDMMNRIAHATERTLPAQLMSFDLVPGSQGVLPEIVQATVHATGVLAAQARAALVIVATRSGRSAIGLSKQRYPTTTLGLSDDPALVRRMALYWGVIPYYFPEPIDSIERVQRVTTWARQEGLLHVGERVVFLLGGSWSDGGHTSVLVQEVT